MKHLRNLIIKFLVVLIVLEIVLSLLTNLNFMDIAYVSLAVTLLSYFIGDLLILPKTNNTVATAADLALSFVTILLFDALIPGGVITPIDALWSSLALALGEWFFHKYLAREQTVLPTR